MTVRRIPKTPEAAQIAAFVDTLDAETREYLRGMVYRVAGFDVPPPPDPSKERRPRIPPGTVTTIHDDLANVIDLAQRRAGGAP